MHIISYVMVLEDAIVWLHSLNKVSRMFLKANHLPISKILKTNSKYK